MNVHPIVNHVFSSVTYVLYSSCNESVWLVDCGDVEALDASVPVEGVLLTHTHFDHIYGLNNLLDRNPDVKIYTNAYGRMALQNPRLNLSHYYPDIPDFVLDNPESIVEIGEESIVDVLGYDACVKSVPGHDGSCLAFIIEDHLFTGDAYIPGKRVVTNLPRCNKEQALSSEQELKAMSSLYLVMPGHMDK